MIPKVHAWQKQAPEQWASTQRKNKFKRFRSFCKYMSIPPMTLGILIEHSIDDIRQAEHKNKKYKAFSNVNIIKNLNTR